MPFKNKETYNEYMRRKRTEDKYKPTQEQKDRFNGFREEQRNKNNPRYTNTPPTWFVGFDTEARANELFLLQSSPLPDGSRIQIEKSPLTIRDVLSSLCIRSTKDYRIVPVWYANKFDLNMLFAHESLETNVSLFKKGRDTMIDDYKL